MWPSTGVRWLPRERAPPSRVSSKPSAAAKSQPTSGKMTCRSQPPALSWTHLPSMNILVMFCTQHTDSLAASQAADCSFTGYMAAADTPAVSNGFRMAQLRMPADLQPFCDIVGIPVVPVPDWYEVFLQSESWIPSQPGNTPRSQRSRPSAYSPPRRRRDMETDESPRMSSARRKTDH